MGRKKNETLRARKTKKLLNINLAKTQETVTFCEEGLSLGSISGSQTKRRTVERTKINLAKLKKHQNCKVKKD